MRRIAGIICLRDGEVMRLQAESGCTPAFVDFMQAHPIRPGRETITGRVFMDGKPVHVADVQLDPEYNFGQRANHRRLPGGARGAADA